MDKTNIKYLQESLKKTEMISEGIGDFLSKGASTIKKSVVEPVILAWNEFIKKTKGVIQSIISSAVSMLKIPGDLITITIPAQEKPRMPIREGAIEAIKGNYNEALTCKYIVEKNKVPIKITIIHESVLNESTGNESDGVVVVDLNVDGKREVSTIDSVVNKWDMRLREEAKDKYADFFKAINIGSRDMAQYLMETTLKEDGLIVAVKIKNLSFQEGAEFKADMELTIEKAGREIIKKYSLKLYGNPEVNVWNTSVPSLLVYLLGPEKKAEILAAFDQDKQFSDLVVKARRVNVEKNLAKKIRKTV